MEEKLRHPRYALSAGQLKCLRLVGHNLTSKEIAVELGISPHTVDARIRAALRTLGVARRTHAARIVTNCDMLAKRELGLPFATHARASNDLSAKARLQWILLIGVGGSAATVVYLAGLHSLARLLGG